MKSFITNEVTWCSFGVLLSVFLRVCTTLHPYSGKSSHPMYGDYEAQRHWMEITVNLPMNEWYNNSTLNDLEYWGLDYPPLTAYHSYINGLIAYLINPEYVELFRSRGYESDAHKLFMRYTVLVADFFVYIPALIGFFVFTRDKLRLKEHNRKECVEYNFRGGFNEPKGKDFTGVKNKGKNKNSNGNDAPLTKTNNPVPPKNKNWGEKDSVAGRNKNEAKSKNSSEKDFSAKNKNSNKNNEAFARSKNLNEKNKNDSSGLRNRNTGEKNKSGKDFETLKNNDFVPPKRNEKDSACAVNKSTLDLKSEKDVLARNKLKLIEIEDKYYSLIFPVILGLLYPGLILIDHGHFQYNCISLGLTVISVTFLFVKSEILSTLFFCLALNYKQMELYHAFPFFFYLLSSCIPKPGENSLTGFFKLVKIASTVLITFGVLWLPFIFDSKTFLQVLNRLFPVARGLFEDKVANVWCSLNVVYKFKNFCAAKMLRYCTLATLTAVLPSSADLFLRPNLRKFIPALINSSLSFFLFSFQVHEKSILLAAIPVVLYLQIEPLACFWFLYISNFSMLPLFIKDGLITAYISLNLIFFLTFFVLIKFNYVDFSFKSDNTFYLFYKQILSAWTNKKSPNEVVNIVTKHVVNNRGLLWNLVLGVIVLLSLAGSGLLSVLICVFEPPSRYPDLFTLFVAIYSCLHFLGFFVYFNVVQFKIPQSFDDVHIKLKEA